MSKFCKACNKEFTKPCKYSYKQWGIKLYCSNFCAAKNRPPISKECRMRAGLALRGRKITDEHKKKISQANRGHKPYIMTDEIRQHMSLANKGRTSPMLGKHHSDIARQKMSMSRQGRTSPMLGKHHSDIARQKMSMSRQGIKTVENWGGYVSTQHYYRTRIKRVKKTKDELQSKKRFRNQRYKANKRNAEGSHTFVEWEQIKKTYHYMCLCCKGIEPEIKLTEDHIIPLSMGGTDYIWNIQPLCVQCNTRKNARAIDYRSSDNQIQILN